MRLFCVTVLLFFGLFAEAGLLDKCGQFQLSGVIKKDPKNKDFYFLQIFPGQDSPINLDIYQEVNLSKKLLPKRLDMFSDVPVQVEGFIKKEITLKTHEFWLEKVDFRDASLTESRDIDKHVKLIKEIPCLK